MLHDPVADLAPLAEVVASFSCPQLTATKPLRDDSEDAAQEQRLAGLDKSQRIQVLLFEITAPDKE